MTKKKRYYIAGTDTDIGKTWVASQLMRELTVAGFSAAGLKPVAAGGGGDGKPYNEDALILQSLSSLDIPYHHVNPFYLDEPAAPHIVAEQQNLELNVRRCREACQPLFSYDVDVCVVEGAGGWLVPLNDKETMADLAKALDCSVILVVGMKLGCINHALLSVNAIMQAKLPLVGWVANYIDPDMRFAAENERALSQRIAAPLLASIPFQQTDIKSEPDSVTTRYFDLEAMGLNS